MSAELVAAAQRGDLRAADALWARCTVVASRVARRWAKNSADVDDLSQAALLLAVERFSGLRDPSAVVGWLQVIVNRSASRGARGLRRQRLLWSGGSDPDVQASLDAPIDLQLHVSRLLERLDALPEEQRRCLWLHRAEGWRIEEIARATELSISTVRRRLRAAETQLARSLRG